MRKMTAAILIVSAWMAPGYVNAAEFKRPQEPAKEVSKEPSKIAAVTRPRVPATVKAFRIPKDPNNLIIKVPQAPRQPALIINPRPVSNPKVIEKTIKIPER